MQLGTHHIPDYKHDFGLHMPLIQASNLRNLSYLWFLLVKKPKTNLQFGI